MERSTDLNDENDAYFVMEDERVRAIFFDEHEARRFVDLNWQKRFYFIAPFKVKAKVFDIGMWEVTYE